MARIRSMIEDVDQAIVFYTRHLGFTLEFNISPAMAVVTRGDLQLLLSGPQSLEHALCLMGSTPPLVAGIA